MMKTKEQKKYTLILNDDSDKYGNDFVVIGNEITVNTKSEFAMKLLKDTGLSFTTIHINETTDLNGIMEFLK